MTPALIVATCLGSGRFPFAPGTFASFLIAILCYILDTRFGWVSLAVLVSLFTVIGFITAGPAARQLGQKDPGCVVIDEAAGMAIACLPATGNWIWFIVAFLGFRLLDIWKPGPIGRVEKWSGGLGIMADDLLAGTFVALGIALARIWWTG